MTEFEETVRKMREQQRLYFRTRDKATLQAAKQYERKVDAMLEGKEREERQPRML